MYWTNRSHSKMNQRQTEVGKLTNEALWWGKVPGESEGKMLVGSVVLPKLRRPIAGCCSFWATQMAATESVTLDSNSRL